MKTAITVMSQISHQAFISYLFIGDNGIVNTVWKNLK
jgi:hypothetical protein